MALKMRQIDDLKSKNTIFMFKLSLYSMINWSTHWNTDIYINGTKEKKNNQIPCGELNLSCD